MKGTVMFLNAVLTGWDDKTSTCVSAVELVSVGKRGLVNMRYKVGKGAWGNWKLPKNAKPGDSNVNHHAVYNFYEAALTGICVRRQEGYGATDFAAAALRWVVRGWGDW